MLRESCWSMTLQTGNLFPSYMSLDEGESGIEEERRLFYVAMTRAMERLYIVFSQGRMLFGQLKFNGPSRFINEIPEKYIVWNKLKHDAEDDYIEDNAEEFYSQEISYEEDITYQQIGDFNDQNKFPVGSNIVHGVYGAGKLIECRGKGIDEKVLILFRDGSKKRFVVKFAPLVFA